jgi:hypothetical protein
LDNLRAFERLASTQIDDAGEALYASIEAVRDLGLGLRRADDANIQEELAGISLKLGIEGETILNQNAVAQGVYFFPKYLNDTMLDFPEYVAQDPGPVKSHGQ